MTLTPLDVHQLPHHGHHDHPVNGNTIEQAQRIAGHRPPRTTKLYGRNPDTGTITEIEKIV